MSFDALNDAAADAAQAARTDDNWIADAAREAARRIAPLWPLTGFVAVNPYLGLADLEFPAAGAFLAATRGARSTLPRAEFAAMLSDGRISADDLAAACEELGAASGLSVNDVETALREPRQTLRIPSAAEAVGRVAGKRWEDLAVERIAAWAASRFAGGEASAGVDGGGALYASWLDRARLDLAPAAAGVPGYRAGLEALPESAPEAIAFAARALGVDRAAAAAYFDRLYASIAGWAGHVRQRGWVGELAGGAPDGAVELLAVRLAWDAILFEGARSDAADAAWADAKRRFAEAGRAEPSRDDRIDEVLLAARERAVRRSFVAATAMGAGAAREPGRPDLQAVFCIDVRSERYRRAIEAADGGVETIGFAGFFGAAVEVAPAGGGAGTARCPVLLTPTAVVSTRDPGASAFETAASRALRFFRRAAVGSFGYVESFGLGYLPRLLRGASGAKRAAAGSDVVDLDPATLDGRRVGLDLETRTAIARGALAGTGLRRRLARLVLLVGHGSTSANNPYASSLDCGACGGHAGDVNARVVAAALNDWNVRLRLEEEGLVIPADTHFLPAIHDTTTDEVTLLDVDAAPASHGGDIEAARTRLAAASERVRRERADALGVPRARAETDVPARAADWSQVRPEWGLAGCAAFIAAPRERTAGARLDGRSFLHSYRHEDDADGAILELIMTAPLVVASWISLQYYASTVDNAVFGSGDKTLHNVVGDVGVIEGARGDIRAGLPLQSVHDGREAVHEPVRLLAMIEAPTEAIDAVLRRHPGVRALFDNRWMQLVAILDEGRRHMRYANGLWREEDGAPGSDR